MNLLIVVVTALIPLLMGFIWYHPRLFGRAWMHSAGLSEEKLNASSMGRILGLTFLLSIVLAFFLQFLVIHQVHIHSFLMNQPGFNDSGSEAAQIMKRIDELFSTSYRTFKHGMFHGVLAGFMFAMPIVAINALFERRSFKYIAIHTGYWMLTLGLMGGITCQFIQL